MNKNGTLKLLFEKIRSGDQQALRIASLARWAAMEKDEGLLEEMFALKADFPDEWTRVSQYFTHQTHQHGG